MHNNFSIFNSGALVHDFNIVLSMRVPHNKLKTWIQFNVLANPSKIELKLYILAMKNIS